MEDNWPYEPQQLYFHVQPRRPNRVRHQSDAHVPRLNNQQIRVDGNGNLMMPVVDEYGRPNRASSVSGQRPNTIIINNDNAHHIEENDRPVSAHGTYINYDGALIQRRPSNRSPGRSPSHHRRRLTPELYDEDDYYTVEGRRAIRYHRESPSPRPIHRRSKEDEDKIRELEEKEKELRAIHEKEKERERKKKIEDEIRLAEIEKKRKKEERDAEDKKLKEKAIEEWKEKEKKEKAKKEKEREEQDAAYIELLRAEGYSEADARKRLRYIQRRKEKGLPIDEDERPAKDETRIVKPKPTFIKVHSRHISPDTLDVFQLPWEFDDRDAGYIIIKQWVTERDQEILFNHTKQIAEKARLTYPRQALKDDASRLVIAKDKSRKKSPLKRTSWIFS